MEGQIMLRHGILGLVNNGDKTGYEIMTVFRDSLSFFWMAQTSQIYRELQFMERTGWISRTHVPQVGKPDKNVYAITQAGLDELTRWLRDTSVPLRFNNPLMMKTFFMGELPVDENIAFFEALRDASVFPDAGEQASANADMYQQALEHPEKAIYWKLTIEYGRMYQKMQRAWCDQCIRELQELRRLQEGMGHGNPTETVGEE